MSAASSGRKRWRRFMVCSFPSMLKSHPTSVRLRISSMRNSMRLALKRFMTTAMPAPALNSRMRSCSAFRTVWSWASAAWMPASSSTATGAIQSRKNSLSPMRSTSFARVWAVSLGTLSIGAAHAADQQKDPELKAVVAHAITQAECFSDRYDSAVWYKMMEPRLRKQVQDKAERLEILKLVFCEAHRPGEVRLPPGLVMAVMHVES